MNLLDWVLLFRSYCVKVSGYQDLPRKYLTVEIFNKQLLMRIFLIFLHLFTELLHKDFPYVSVWIAFTLFIMGSSGTISQPSSSMVCKMKKYSCFMTFSWSDEDVAYAFPSKDAIQWQTFFSHDIPEISADTHFRTFNIIHVMLQQMT